MYTVKIKYRHRPVKTLEVYWWGIMEGQWLSVHTQDDRVRRFNMTRLDWYEVDPQVSVPVQSDSDELE